MEKTFRPSGLVVLKREQENRLDNKTLLTTCHCSWQHCGESVGKGMNELVFKYQTLCKWVSGGFYGFKTRLHSTQNSACEIAWKSQKSPN